MLKTQVWSEAQRERVQCPACNKTVTRRVLRWRHVCPSARLPILLSQEAAHAYESSLSEMALKQLQARLAAKLNEPQRKHDPLPLKRPRGESDDTASPSS